MLKGIKTYLQFGNKYCGIEHVGIDDELAIIATVLKKQKNEIKLDQEFEAISIEEIAKSIPQKQHAFLVLNDGNVLTKLVESDQNESLKLVFKAFPNINLDEFYFEVLSQGNRHFISLCRKNVVDGIIEEYKRQDISIINFSLGNTIAVSLKEFIPSHHINTSNAHLIFGNNGLQVIQAKTEMIPTSYDVNGLETDSQHLLSLAGALDSIIHQNNSQKNFDNKVETLYGDYSLSRVFKLGLKSSAFAFLVILLINFLIFSHYHSQVAILEQKVQTNQSTLDQMTQLGSKVTNAQRMVEEVFIMSHSKSSFYIDAIVRCQPKNILLDKLDFQPLKKTIKKGKPIELDENVILISGESTSSSSFSEWLVNMEAMSWISQINIVDYRDVSSLKSTFQLKIEMDDN